MVLRRRSCWCPRDASGRCEGTVATVIGQQCGAAGGLGGGEAPAAEALVCGQVTRGQAGTLVQPADSQIRIKTIQYRPALIGGFLAQTGLSLEPVTQTGLSLEPGPP